MIWPASFELLRALMECWRFYKCVHNTVSYIGLMWKLLETQRIRIPSTRNETTSYNYWHIVSRSFLFFFFFFRFEGIVSVLSLNTFSKLVNVSVEICKRRFVSMPRKWRGLKCVLGKRSNVVIITCYERLVFGVVSTSGYSKFREFWGLLTCNC